MKNGLVLALSRILLAGVAGWPLVTAPVHAQSPTSQEGKLDLKGSDRTAAEAVHALKEAQLKKDRGSLERLLAPDFVVLFEDGRIGGRDDFIAEMTDPAFELREFEYARPSFLKVSATVAIVSGDLRLKGIYRGEEFKERFRYSDVVALRGGRWVVVHDQISRLEY